MLDVLERVLRDMPDILESSVEQWHWQRIDSSPLLDRLVRTVTVDEEKFDLFLHRGYSNGKAEPHTHPCQAAMYVAKGRYRLELGAGEKFIPAGTVILNEGCMYQMTHPYSWHCFTPLSDYTLSVMVAGRLYKVPLPGQPGMQHEEVSKEITQEVLERFQKLEW